MKSTPPPVWRAHLAVLACMVAPGASLAAPLCVSLDEALTASDDQANKGALILVRAAFEEQGETVVDPPCGNEYKVAQVQTGDVFTVSLRGPERTRTGRAGSANELPKVYDQLVRAQLSGDLAVTGSQAVGRHNVTTEQANPMRARADSIFLIDLGPAIVRGVDGVPLSLGGAWRYELDQYGVQIAADFVWNPTDDTDSKTVGGSFGIGGLLFLDPTADATLYGGLGFDYSGWAATTEKGVYSANGLQGRVIAGFCFLRSSNLRMLIQADLLLPFYDLTLDLDEPGANGRRPVPGTDAAHYAPTLMIRAGIGFEG